MPRLRLALLALVTLATACASLRFRQAQRIDTVDGWRAFLASHADRGAEIDFARERLEQLSWKAALAENTPRAYRRFADDFPESEHADEATGRLAALRYQKAERGAAAGLNVFLEDEPTGTLAMEARAKLAELEYAAAVKMKGLAPIELYLARFPEGPHLDEARALADDRAYAAAAAGGTLGLTDYVATHPDGKHRGAAEEKLLEARITALVAEGRFDEGQASLRVGAKLPAHDRLAAMLDAARKQAQLAVVSGIEGVSRAELEAVQEQAFALARPDPAAVAQIAGELEESDPASRWRAAAALGATGSVFALDPLLAAASGSHFFRVRLTAARAVLDLVSGWPDSVREEELSRRVLALRPMAASAELSDRVGLLEEAAGHANAARDAFAQSRHYDAQDLLALAEGMKLAREAGDAGARLTLAHDLVEAAAQYGDDRIRDQGLPPLLGDRQACGLVDLGRLGVAELAHAGAEAATWLPAAKAEVDRLVDLLAEQERLAAAEDTTFQGCALDAEKASNPESAEVARKLAAVTALAAKLGAGAEGEVVKAVLAEAAAHDGASEVRKAAAAALAGRP